MKLLFNNNNKSIVAAVLLGVSSSFSTLVVVEAHPSVVPLGQEIYSPLATNGILNNAILAREDYHPPLVNFGSTVRISDNGRYMLVGAPNFDYWFHADMLGPDGQQKAVEKAWPNKDGGAVFLYERKQPPELEEEGANNADNASTTTSSTTGDDSDSHNNIQYSDWKLIWAELGKPGEQLGRYISLDSSGRWFALRRGTNESRNVQVHIWVPEWQRAVQFGTIDGNKDGCPGSHVEIYHDYLVTSCEMFRGGRGKVQVYKLDIANVDLKLLLEIEGDYPGARFGWRALLDPTINGSPKDGSFRLAISSPNYKDKTGMVQVYDYSYKTGVLEEVSLDGEMVGSAPGDQFGYSMALNNEKRADHSYLAVGAPRSSSSSADGNNECKDCGSLHIYKYPSSEDGKGDVPEWKEIFTAYGAVDGDRLGRSVAMDEVGDRVAVSSTQHDALRGLVQVYERTDRSTYEMVWNVTGDHESDRWGHDVALSRSGSMLVSGSTRKRNANGDSVGGVKVLLDRSPFCSWKKRPSSDDRYPFEDRKTCGKYENDGVPKRNEADCNAMSWCTWIDTDYYTKSSSPTSNPTDPPTGYPTSSPTEAPTGPPTAPEVALSLTGCPCDYKGRCVTTTAAEDDQDSSPPPRPNYLCIAGSRTDLKLLGMKGSDDSSLESGGNDSGAHVVILGEKGSQLFNVTALCGVDTCVLRTNRPIISDSVSSSGAAENSSGMVFISFGGSSSNNNDDNRRRLFLRGGGNDAGSEEEEHNGMFAVHLEHSNNVHE